MALHRDHSLVDDATLEAEHGDPEVCAAIVAGATDTFVEQLETRLDLEVSAKKSGCLAGPLQLAKLITDAMHTRKVRPVKSAKLLGTTSGGGRRRRIKALSDRLVAFLPKARRIQALRRSGIRTKAIVRAAGTPAVMYGVANTGMSDSMLNRTRSALARAAAPEGHGKDPNLILWALDGTAGTLDPAFDAHYQPFFHYASAWWEDWQQHDILRRAFYNDAKKEKARLRKFRLRKAKTPPSPWGAVTGPIAALRASAARIGWTFSSPTVCHSESGLQFDLLVDPPVVVGNAVKHAVRAWRRQQIMQKYPSVVPAQPDYD